MTEVWIDISGYEGLYQVSNLGRVKSCERKVAHYPKGLRLVKEKIMKQSIVRGGYCMVELSKNNTQKCKIVSKLVAVAFIPFEKNDLEVNHKDGNKKNNNVENLEWLTHKQNQEHAVNNKLYKMSPIFKVDINGEIIESYNSIGEASRKNNLIGGNIWAVCEGKRVHVKGHYFKYQNL
jgi:hypothetical protein